MNNPFSFGNYNGDLKEKDKKEVIIFCRNKCISKSVVDLFKRKLHAMANGFKLTDTFSFTYLGV